MAVTFTTSAGSAGGVQSSYALELTAALEGQFADIADNSVSTFVNETGAVVAYGNLGRCERFWFCWQLCQDHCCC